MNRRVAWWRSATAELLFAAAVSLCFLCLSVRELIHRGGAGSVPTIVSRTGLSPRSSEASLLLLAEAARVIPPGSTIAFLNPRDRARDWIHYAVAVGQMPQFIVVYPQTLSGGSAPQFLIVSAHTMDDSQYGLWRVVPHGTILIRK